MSSEEEVEIISLEEALRQAANGSRFFQTAETRAANEKMLQDIRSGKLWEETPEE